ncbi:hypothetical protein [Streptomyces sp. NPDC012510]|uniref:hypothetical protein n=1 Tax=Streptomyces sp. NPDC012510 TaxID=3364838 RepID=UPI0036E41ECC
MSALSVLLGTVTERGEHRGRRRVVADVRYGLGCRGRRQQFPVDDVRVFQRHDHSALRGDHVRFAA